MSPSEIPADGRYEELIAPLRPVVERIAVDARERERDERLATEQLGWLVDAGFARWRTPVAWGGVGARLSDVLRAIAELAEVDPNLAHVWRNHFSFVEDRVHARGSAFDHEIVGRLGRGELVGGGWSETPNATGADITTTIARDPAGGWRVSGRKFYSTGSVYARWITVLAVADDGERFVALVDAEDPAVVVGDDWDGFGQRVTGSGSVTYADVPVPDERVLPYATRYPYQEQYYQSVMHAILVGIGRAALREGVEALRARARGHHNGTTTDPTRDPELLGVIGTVAARVYAADAAFVGSLGPLDEAVDRHAALRADDDGDGDGDGDDDGDDDDDGGRDAIADPARPAALRAALERSWTAVAHAQTIVTDAVLDATTLVFDALGSSGTFRSLGLDRHWRNARTLASHNPRVHKRRIVGDLLVNGTSPLDPRSPR
ncbi:alkylation response protein AidB-like acyl-CoA dehydrogenase [Curtobacterium flaccumfaciens]|uniref:Dibenzothiophene monooxygenase n=1 Tax=Curtobacterium flaccumfaciens TaxID=2035 RepID=A0A4R6DGK9_9MICO|nr:acyl-CoA dehydrogenase family protein [Curtobacterium flaccumfaciens]TDN43159.1 alkylation response protein AidB-like acyl-CoA dehydrogenase [Curtobacterium flaccumfaciens]